MKKLFLSFAVIAGMSMISCGNKAADENAAEATDSIETVEETEVVDSAAAVVDSAAVATDSVAAAAEVK
jgi:flavin-binding protein dodecin